MATSAGSIVVLRILPSRKPQGRMIFPAMTVRKNIETGLVASGEKELPGDIYELFPILLEKS
jgi:ABC-type branched-subunit amino acid transport system ATPase component